MIVLTTTNQKYVPVVSNLLKTFKTYHSDIKIIVSCVNVSKQSLMNMSKINENVEFIIENIEFNNTNHERNYCAHNRVYHMPNLMKTTKQDIFWLDADVYLRGDINPFIAWLQDYDFANLADGGLEAVEKTMAQYKSDGTGKAGRNGAKEEKKKERDSASTSKE